MDDLVNEIVGFTYDKATCSSQLLHLSDQLKSKQSTYEGMAFFRNALGMPWQCLVDRSPAGKTLHDVNSNQDVSRGVKLNKERAPSLLAKLPPSFLIFRGL